MPFAFHYNPGQHAPFSIYIAHDHKTRGGTTWKPSALVCAMPALHASDFLSCLDAAEFRSLVLLLSFLAPDGRCQASVPVLAQALGISRRQARARFQQLAAVRWHGQAIVFHSEWGGDLDGFAPAPGFVPVFEEPLDELERPALHVVPREVLIAHSRRVYARPREEVERDIAEMMDWHPRPETPNVPALSSEEQRLRDDLLAVGLLEEQAHMLMAQYDSVRIRRQLAWLPHRHAKNSAGYLIAAIKDNYAAPRLPAFNSDQEDDA